MLMNMVIIILMVVDVHDSGDHAHEHCVHEHHCGGRVHEFGDHAHENSDHDLNTGGRVNDSGENAHDKM